MNVGVVLVGVIFLAMLSYMIIMGVNGFKMNREIWRKLEVDFPDNDNKQFLHICRIRRAFLRGLPITLDKLKIGEQGICITPFFYLTQNSIYIPYKHLNFLRKEKTSLRSERSGNFIELKIDISVPILITLRERDSKILLDLIRYSKAKKK
ncbi:hypothetical protein [Sediminitomix flava]|uniref:Uncharacterized protein n=1 Tax=Sediminitomix flava TaxID=379075 RepID=A0A315YVE8_SEDFL|nr:hypothetical protein [Sediminitomix flava]PWJ33244.1 hypothetical protein BC781_1146 [Sediminitomix flava]